MPYEITIKETRTVRAVENGKWTVVEKRLWSDDELKEASRYYSNEQTVLKETPLKEVLGYTPSREVSNDVSVEVLKQTVETLDLAAVIKAINNL